MQQKVEEFVFQLFKDKLSSEFTYHNFLHTQYVVQKVLDILATENLNQDEAEEVVLAAWFHDVGYVNALEKHEAESARIAEEFLREEGFSTERIQRIKHLILATETDFKPTVLSEMILRDADCAHVGSEQFEEISQQLRAEFEKQGNSISEKEWHEGNYKFLVFNHKFYTDYAKKNWQPIKFANLVTLQETLRKLEQEGMSKSEVKKRKLEKLDTPERGIDTMFRVTLNNHTRLSEIADSKANILLSVNAIIISIALSTLLPKLATPKHEYLIFPTLVMLMVSVLSIISAISATRPNITKNEFTIDQIKNNKINILFFGNFHKLSINQYEEAIAELMKDKEYLYNSLTRDLYFLGVVLDKKYKILRRTYNIFLVGIILTVISFVVAFWFNLNA